MEVEKIRLRYRVLYQGTEFYINVDSLIKPVQGNFLEIKSRTWSRRDADHKAGVVTELLKFLCASPENIIDHDYLEMALAISDKS